MKTIARTLIALSTALPIATNAALKCDYENGEVTCHEILCGTNSDCGSSSQTTEPIQGELNKNNLDQRSRGELQEQIDTQWQIPQETLPQELNQ